MKTPQPDPRENPALRHPFVLEGDLYDGALEETVLVPPASAHKSPLTESDVIKQSPFHATNAMLRAFSHNHPFVPVFPMPQYVTTIFSAGPNQIEVRLHDAVVAVMFTCTPGLTMYVNFNGMATNATATNFDPATMVDPTGFLMFCYGRRAVYMATDGAGSMSCYQYVQDALAGLQP